MEFFSSAPYVSANNEVVHRVSLSDRILQAGDIANLAIGMEWPFQAVEKVKNQKRLLNSYSL